MKPGETWADHSDIVTRVFIRKLHKLLDRIIDKEHFGKVVCHAHSIEQQERGMPHAHILLTLDKSCKITTPGTCDKVGSM